MTSKEIVLEVFPGAEAKSCRLGWFIASGPDMLSSPLTWLATEDEAWNNAYSRLKKPAEPTEEECPACGPGRVKIPGLHSACRPAEPLSELGGAGDAVEPCPNCGLYACGVNCKYYESEYDQPSPSPDSAAPELPESGELPLLDEQYEREHKELCERDISHEAFIEHSGQLEIDCRERQLREAFRLLSAVIGQKENHKLRAETAERELASLRERLGSVPPKYKYCECEHSLKLGSRCAECGFLFLTDPSQQSKGASKSHAND